MEMRGGSTGTSGDHISESPADRHPTSGDHFGKATAHPINPGEQFDNATATSGEHFDKATAHPINSGEYFGASIIGVHGMSAKLSGVQLSTHIPAKRPQAIKASGSKSEYKEDDEDENTLTFRDTRLGGCVFLFPSFFNACKIYR
jgi:hypothetical protein